MNLVEEFRDFLILVHGNMVEFLLYSIGLYMDTHYILELSHKLKVSRFRLANNKALYGVKDGQHHLL